MHEQKPRPTTELCDQITSEIDLALDANQIAMTGLGFVVHEIHRPLAALDHDTFIDDLLADPNQEVLFSD